MLVYAIVLILVMLATNNATFRDKLGKCGRKIKSIFGGKAREKEETANV